MTDLRRSRLRRWRMRLANGALVLLVLSSGVMLFFPSDGGGSGDSHDLLDRAHAGMRRAADYFESRLSTEGSYVWEYDAENPQLRSGEDEVTTTQSWVQPPGTPTVGLAFLRAFAATGDAAFLKAAHRTAEALVRTQLESGGWWYRIEFDPAARRAWCYRTEPDPCPDGDENRYRDASTLDDNTTQAALSFLMLTDAVLEGEDPAIHEAVRYGLARLRAAQYPNGAWPVRLDERKPTAFGLAPARLPRHWPHEYLPVTGVFFSLNDHLIRDMIRMFLLAHRLYGKPADLQAARRAGEFLIAARLPPPQAGWAQTYNSEMTPTWGRPFEPPALASRETAGCIEALLELYLYTGEEPFMEPLKEATDWLGRSQRRDGFWSRFYELHTNRPLYMRRAGVDSEYVLTYDHDDLPSHYGFVGTFGISEVLAKYYRVAREGREAYLAEARRSASEVERRIALARIAEVVSAILEDLDKHGRWVEDGEIRTATFAAHMAVLAKLEALGGGHVTSWWDELFTLEVAQ